MGENNAYITIEETE